MNIIIRIFAAAFLAAFALGHAAPASAGQPYNWSGFSVGIQGIVPMDAKYDDSWSYSYPGWSASGSTTSDMHGGAIGLRADALKQWNYLVLGVFADINKTNFSGKKDLAPGGYGYTDVFEAKVDWLGSAGITAGIAFDRLLAYGLVGGVYERLSGCEYFAVTGFSSTNCTKYGAAGFLWGFGVKYPILENLIAGLEYRDMSPRALSASNVDSGGFVYKHDIVAPIKAVAATLSWKFAAY